MNLAPILAIFILSISFSLSAKELYLASNGSNDNPGTKAKPWKGLQHAINQMKPGDTLLIRGGTYHQAAFGTLYNSDNPIVKTNETTTISSYGNEKVTFSGRLEKEEVILGKWKKIGRKKWQVNVNPAYRILDGLWVDNQYYPRVEEAEDLVPGKWLFGYGDKSAGIHFAEEHSDNSKLEFFLGFMISFHKTPGWSLKGINAVEYNQAGVSIWQTSRVKVSDCSFSKNRGSGIHSYYAGSLTIENNIAHQNGLHGGISWGSGIHLQYLTDKKNLIRKNRSYSNRDTSRHHTDGNGISIDESFKRGGAVVSENFAFNNGGRGIDVTKSENVVIKSNKVYSNGKDRFTANWGEISFDDQSTKGLKIIENDITPSPKNPAITMWVPFSKSVKGPKINKNTFFVKDKKRLFFSRIDKQHRDYNIKTWRERYKFDTNSRIRLNLRDEQMKSAY